MMQWLRENVEASLLDQFQIIPTRVRELEDKPRILWLHDLPEDPECVHLGKRENVEKFEKLVCVSHWQKDRFLNYFHETIRPEEIIVIPNAIYPIENIQKPDNQVRLIYHTTPHRGLDILLSAYEYLFRQYGAKIHLDIFSSFKIYDRPAMDDQFKELFEHCKKHPGISYHGTKSNSDVREALARAHIFAYPCNWMETSCIAAIEALSAKCCVIHPDLAALPETCSKYGAIYPYTQNKKEHAENFASVCENVINQYLNGIVSDQMLNHQKGYIDTFYGWQNRKHDWTSLLKALSRRKPNEDRLQDGENE